MTLVRTCFLLIALLFLPGSAARYLSVDDPPYSPEEALTRFHLADGFQVEVFAAEPHIADPVAMEVDEYGRVYVVEMPGYPLDVSGSGRVRQLHDTDGDGLPDTSTVFADGLTLPNGIMRWKDGVLVTDAPDVLYFEDTDGDGHADVREVVLTGFALSNPQHNMNAPLYGLDNGIYLANSGTNWWTDFEQFKDRGRVVRFPDRPDGPTLPMNAADRNVRFRPDTYELENLSTTTQFGQTFDAWGHHFMVSNANHHFVEAIAGRYLTRNPGVQVRRAMHETPVHGGAAEVYPVTLDPEHQLLTDRGVFTSACGITYYLGGLFPESYRHITFVAEPVHNLIHTDIVADDGATFTARRQFEGREFLASEDAWFRPVNFYIGPDGALYVIDYYRKIVEHPEWMDDELGASDVVYTGSDRGRIYRITPTGTTPVDWVDTALLAEAGIPDLVDALDHANIWWRRTAQRLLVDAQDAAAAPLLQHLALESERPEARLHALWTLDGLNRLDPATIVQALRDPVAGVRENAVRLTEKRLETFPDLVDALLAMQEDSDPKVRYQLLLTLGEIPTETSRQVRQDLLFRDLEDKWVQVAYLTAPDAGVPEQLVAFLDRLTVAEQPGLQAFLENLAMLVTSSQNAEAMQHLLSRSLEPAPPSSEWWRAALLRGIAERLRGQTIAHPEHRADLVDLVFEDATPDLRTASLQLIGEIGLPDDSDAGERASRLARDLHAEPAHRADAIRLLALESPNAHQDVLRALITPEQSAVVQQAAIRALGQTTGTDAVPFLLDRWAQLTPQLRSEAVDVMMASPERMALLLDAVEEGIIFPNTIGWGRRVVLMRDTEGEIRERARMLLSIPEDDRAAVVAQFQPVLERSGDVRRGERVFERVCATCHRAGETPGADFGPDLATVRHWPKASLLAEILDPNQAIADSYEHWLVQRTDGTSLSGIIASETPTSVTLHLAGGGEHVLPRSDIARVTAIPTSAMPDGLEQQLSEQDLSDLLSFLKSGS